MNGVGAVGAACAIIGVRSCANTVDLDLEPFLVLAESDGQVVGVDGWGDDFGGFD